VLTASHVVPDDLDTPIDVRVEMGQPRWRKNGRVKWRDKTLDAALIQVGEPLPADVVPVKWGESLPAEDARWNSYGYPEASLSGTSTQPERKSAGLHGTFYVGGGGGQGPKELDLGVENEAAMKDWAGVSGAPVFVGDALVGLVRVAAYEGRRFFGTPTPALRENAEFRIEIETPWLVYPREGPWLLALVSEAGSEQDFLTAVTGSFARHETLITKALDGPLPDDHIVPVRVLEAVDTASRWLQLVEAMCAAPLMIADVTGFEPGVMLALGVRAVVRRGVTVATTSKGLDEIEFAKLPFNIQETKLISHGDTDPNITADHPLYSLNIIARTFLSGIYELKINPRYLDLPAYDAVRCPPPDTVLVGLDRDGDAARQLPPEQQRERETVLVLCSFHKEYDEHWRQLVNAVSKYYPKKRTARMRDVVSPRLVGQALYESIRWTTTCVVDWTHWRANVFFELGVRLGCSNIEPVLLLCALDAPPSLDQIKKLISLFGPSRYELADVKLALTPALKAHDQQINDRDERPRREETRIPFNGTYDACLAAFEFMQERVTMPHDFLRFANEALLGKDRQRTGASPVLYSSNSKFTTELSHSVRERWIAAWLYLRNRYPEHELRSNARWCKEIKQLGETLLQEVRDDPAEPSEPFIGDLRGQVAALIESLDEQKNELKKN
jgi:hypothetical protein